jgi:bacterioferritin-associated ferredoxin
MIVCSCNRLSDRDVNACCQPGEALRVVDVYRRLGCAPQCGRCAPTISAMLKDKQQGACCASSAECVCAATAAAVAAA